MRNPLQQVVSSEPYVSLTGADRMRHRLVCGHDVTRDKPKGRAPQRLRCDTCPTATAVAQEDRRGLDGKPTPTKDRCLASRACRVHGRTMDALGREGILRGGAIIMAHGGARPNAGGRRPKAGRPRAADPRTVKLNVALTKKEADIIAAQAEPGELAGTTLRRLALEMVTVRAYKRWLDQGKK